MRVNDLFAVHRLNGEGMAHAVALAEGFSGLLEKIESVAADGRDLALARTHLQTACFFAKRAMALKESNQEIKLTDPHPAVPAATPAVNLTTETFKETVDRFIKHAAGGGVRFVTMLKEYGKSRALDLSPDEQKDFQAKLQAAMA